MTTSASADASSSGVKIYIALAVIVVVVVALVVLFGFPFLVYVADVAALLAIAGLAYIAGGEMLWNLGAKR